MPDMSCTLTAVMPSLCMTSCMTRFDSSRICSRKTAVPLRVDMPCTMPKLTCCSVLAHG